MYLYKKIFLTILIFSLYYITLSTSYAAEGDVWIEISDTNISAGHEFIIEINIDPGGEEFSSFDLIFNFDSQFCKLDLDKGTNGVQIGKDLSSSKIGSNSIEITEGQVKIVGRGNVIDSDILNIAVIYLKTNDRFICDKYAIFSVNMLNSSNDSGASLLSGSSARAWIANFTCPNAFSWPIFMPAILYKNRNLQN